MTSTKGLARRRKSTGSGRKRISRVVLSTVYRNPASTTRPAAAAQSAPITRISGRRSPQGRSGESGWRSDRGRFNHFVYVRATGDRFEYCAIDRDRMIRDGGWFTPTDAIDTLFPAGSCPALE